MEITKSRKTRTAKQLMIPLIFAFIGLDISMGQSQEKISDPEVNTYEDRISELGSNKAIDLRHSVTLDPDKNHDLEAQTLDKSENKDKHLAVVQAHLLLAKQAKKNDNKELNAFHLLSAAQEIEKNVTNHDSNKILAATYYDLGLHYQHAIDIEKSIHYFRKALQLFELTKNKKFVSKALMNIASNENSQENYVAALSTTYRGLEVHKELNDLSGFSDLSLLIGTIYRNIGNYEKALEHLEQAFQMYQSDENYTRMAETAIQTGIVYSALQQVNKARSYFHISLNLPKERVEALTLAEAYYQTALIDIQEEQFDNALAMLRTAERIYIAKGQKDKASLMTNHMGKVHSEKGQVNEAIKHFQKSLTLAEKANDKELQIRSLNHLAHITQRYDIDDAQKFLIQATTFFEAGKFHSDQLWTYAQLKNIEKERKNPSKALHYADLEIKLIKLVSDDHERAKLVQAKAKLDSHNVEIELDKLREKVKVDALKLAQKNSEIKIFRQSNTISELELTKNRYIVVLLTIMLITCIGAVIYIYRIFVSAYVKNKELKYLAARDPLTNCANRRALFERLNNDFENIEKFKEYSIILADIDYFKEVNDKHGHVLGDKVLRGVASILRSSIRQTDIAARYGGEEFCIVLPGADANRAAQIAEAIRTKVEETPFDSIGVTCSFGIASIKTKPRSPKELIDQADLALYKSKGLGRNKVSLWETPIKPEK